MGAAQASALRISQLEREVERLKDLDAKVAALSKRIEELERKEAEDVAQTNYPDATPTAANATSYDQHREKCCTNVDHWKALVRGNQRSKLEDYVKRMTDKFKYETDFEDKFITDRNGNKIPRGEDACWVKRSLLKKRGYKQQYIVKITCPISEIRNLPLSISVCKIIAIMNHAPDSPEVDRAFGEPFSKSDISLEILLTFQQRRISRHHICVTLVHVSTRGTSQGSMQL
jgi:hypothetical protein